MNWKTSIIMAHIWVIAYTVEPVMLFLLEPRVPEAKAPLPPELRRGSIFAGLKGVVALGLIVCVTIASLAIINPQFLSTRWPWPLDPFDARIMAAFFALNAVWGLTTYFAGNWGEIRLAVLGMILFTVSNFFLWLVILPLLDKARPNVYGYGVGFGLFSIVLIYYFWRQERVRP